MSPLGLFCTDLTVFDPYCQDHRSIFSQYGPDTWFIRCMYCLFTQAEQKTGSSSKIQSLFDADDDDEGMFGGTADDIFAASPSQV